MDVLHCITRIANLQCQRLHVTEMLTVPVLNPVVMFCAAMPVHNITSANKPNGIEITTPIGMNERERGQVRFVKCKNTFPRLTLQNAPDPYFARISSPWSETISTTNPLKIGK